MEINGKDHTWSLYTTSISVIKRINRRVACVRDDDWTPAESVDLRRYIQRMRICLCIRWSRQIYNLIAIVARVQHSSRVVTYCSFHIYFIIFNNPLVTIQFFDSQLKIQPILFMYRFYRFLEHRHLKLYLLHDCSGNLIFNSTSFDVQAIFRWLY